MLIANDFSILLEPQVRGVIQIIKKTNYDIVENIAWCASQDGGSGTRENGTFFICTNSIMAGSSPSQNVLGTQGEVSGRDAYPQKISQHFRDDWDGEKHDESTSSAIKPDELGKFRQFAEAYGL